MENTQNNMKITEAEWKVMEYLWEHGASSMTEIRQALEPTGWNSSTIKTLVTRLINKGAVNASGKIRQTKYSPAVTIDECRLRETKYLLDRIYNGSLKMMVSNLVKDSSLSETETNELLNLIDKMDD